MKPLLASSSRARIVELEAEVGRLRAELDKETLDRVDLQGQVERLRATTSKLSAKLSKSSESSAWAWEAYGRESRDMHAEIERLRAELEIERRDRT